MREKENTLIGVDSNKPTVFKLVKKNAKPALQGRYYPSIKRLPHEETIYDPIKKSNRIIRYAPGEQSVYKDEQPEKVVLGDIVFQNGTIVVQYTNPLLLTYLGLSNYNQSNPSRMRGFKAVFSELDPEGDAHAQIDIEIEQLKAGNAVLQMDFSELKAYARVLGVNISNGADMIRHDMLKKAKASPAMFMAGIDDPIIKRQQVLLDGMSYKIIELSGRSLNWLIGDKKSLIVPIPIGQGLPWVAEWTMNDKDGEEVFREIEKKVKALSS